ncbi:hypothetical protein SDC9_211667 [bioreactor metagenome]|uniref:Uncharacterized protein n=1 Tax=bioreactor metagenome TaxID=1076179 RepID=A0A645JLB4_9ZZZZ
MKEVKPIVQSEARGFSEHYDAITQKLDEFLLHDFNRIKIDRNLSIHYDKNPMLLYKMIINLDLDEKLPLILDFMKVIDEMFHFTEILGKHLYENFDDIIDKIHR